MSDAKQTTTSFPLIPILGIIFVTLKLCHVIAWSWIWVTAPFWAPVALLLIVVIVAFAVGTFTAMAKSNEGINNSPLHAV